jgi:hypothetical protein
MTVMVRLILSLSLIVAAVWWESKWALAILLGLMTVTHEIAAKLREIDKQ